MKLNGTGEPEKRIKRIYSSEAQETLKQTTGGGGGVAATPDNWELLIVQSDCGKLGREFGTLDRGPDGLGLIPQGTRTFC